MTDLGAPHDDKQRRHATPKERENRDGPHFLSEENGVRPYFPKKKTGAYNSPVLESGNFACGYYVVGAAFEAAFSC
jgi:hypothetical protein